MTLSKQLKDTKKLIFCGVYTSYAILMCVQSRTLMLNAILTLPARPSRTAATTVAQAPVPHASVAPKMNSNCIQLSIKQPWAGLVNCMATVNFTIYKREKKLTCPTFPDTHFQVRTREDLHKFCQSSPMVFMLTNQMMS